MKTLFSKEIARIRNLQRGVSELNKRVDGLTRQFTKYINKRLAQEYRGIKFDWCGDLGAGCMTNKWTPNALVFAINGCEWNGKNWCKFVFINENSFKGNWEKIDAPIPTRQFRAFIKKLSSETGIPIRLVTSCCSHRSSLE
jgi:hypothetical protein